MCKNLNCGGTEIALVNLLRHIDQNKYKVTLLLQEREGIYFDRIPAGIEVRILFSTTSTVNQILENKKNRIKTLSVQAADICVRLMQKIQRDRITVYDVANKLAMWDENEYDIALDFQGYGFFMTAFVADRVKAKVKAIWIHDENIGWLKYVLPYFKKYDWFFGVSQSCVDVVKKEYPWVCESMNSAVFPNYLDWDRIITDAQKDIDDNRFIKKNSIVTVGRLVEQKGYDMAIKAANNLRNAGVDFHWYVIGGGELFDKLTKQIVENSLEDRFFLLGAKSNPYPYIFNCDIYAQTSRHEGFGLAIAEAKVLNKIIVSTDIACIREQLVEGVTGVFSSFDPCEYSKILLEILQHYEDYKYLEENLRGFKNNTNYDPLSVFDC